MRNLRFIAVTLTAGSILLAGGDKAAYADDFSQEFNTYHDYSKDTIEDSGVISKSTKEAVFNMINTVVYENENILDPDSFKDLTTYPGVILPNSIRRIEYTGDEAKLSNNDALGWEADAKGILAYRDAVINNIDYNIGGNYTVTDDPCTIYQIEASESTHIYVNIDTSEIYIKSKNRDNFESFVAFKNGIKTISKYRIINHKAISSYPYYEKDYATDWMPLTTDWLTYTYSEDWKNYSYIYTMFGNDYHYTTDTKTLYIKNGVLHDGWTKINGEWHYFDANIPIDDATWTIDGKEYFFDENGIWKTGWIEHRGVWFYFYPDGDFAKDTYIDGYYLDAEGNWCKNHDAECDICF